ncbi:MAG TPA: sialidase family protein, partial [Candidatus Hydrogenedentes bacterium]|nr:sialidase family protein [Candidatus Hydrogenedentota bacterium]
MRKRGMCRWLPVGIVVVAGMLLCLAADAAPPPEMVIRGQLLDAQGKALAGNREYRVRFFDAPTGGAQLGGDFGGVTELSNEGLFSLVIVPPTPVLNSASAWYEVAVDSDAAPDGLGANDVFPNRVKVSSVPFALQTQAVTHVNAPTIAGGQVSNTEFNTLDGVASGIQGQLNAKANLADVYTKAQVDTSQAAQNTAIAAKANAADVYTKSQSDTRYVAKTGDTMTGSLTVNNSFVGVGPAAAPSPTAGRLYNVGGDLYWGGSKVQRFGWNVVTGASQQMAPNNGYVANSASEIGFTLPPSAALAAGDTLYVRGYGAGGWRIGQGAGQTIDTGQIGTLGFGGIYWTDRGMAGIWSAFASSSDGSKLLACDGSMPSKLYTSADFGASWTLRRTGGEVRSWWSVASSSDGTKLVACVLSGQIYTSTDSGATWTPRDSNRSWCGVASSADGTKLAACVNNGQIYTSTDSGATWTARDSNRSW